MTLILNTDKIENSFRETLSHEKNKRIILSGRFGIGKTTFIDHFFKKNNQFVHIHLYPINYVVATNEDIFELIKYDVLYELINLNPSFENVEVDWFDSLNFLESDDITKILSAFVGMIPQVGKDIASIIEGVSNISKSFKKKHKELKKTEFDEIFSFVKLIESTKGNIYENDFYTKLISSIVSSLRINEQKIILTIDDLDRIDPEHIFRILNIFGAHLDTNNLTNKFGLDSIILCCDIENIKRIYHHKYGREVDFYGYISKFYSQGVFYYDNTENTKNIINSILNSLTKKETIANSVASEYNSNGLLLNILIDLVNSNTITLRELFRHVGTEYNLPEKELRSIKKKVWNWQLPPTLVFEFIMGLFGNQQAFLEAIQKTSFAKIIDDEKIRIIGDLMLVCSLGKTSLVSIRNGEDRNILLTTNNNSSNFSYHSTIGPFVFKNKSYDIYYSDLINDRNIDDIPLNELIYEAAKVYLAARDYY